MNPRIVGSNFYNDHHKKDPQFMEIAMFACVRPAVFIGRTASGISCALRLPSDARVRCVDSLGSTPEEYVAEGVAVEDSNA